MKTTMSLFLSWLAICFALPLNAHSALVLSGTQSVGITAGANAQIHIDVEGNAGLPTQVLGWQTNLLIAPNAGATGSVDFVGASVPSQNYLLGANGSGLDVTIPAANRIKLFDADSTNPLDGGVIVASQTLGLANIQLSASNDASGTFSLFLVDEGPAAPGDAVFRTHWVNDIFEDVQFGNIARDAPPALFATITVVPEPSAFACILFIAVIVASVRFARVRMVSTCKKRFLWLDSQCGQEVRAILRTTTLESDAS